MYIGHLSATTLRSFRSLSLSYTINMSADDHTLPERPSEPNHAPLTDYTVIQETLTGTVKWFNNKAGFGFITICEEGEYKDKDIFVHYSSIRVSNSQYKYLLQGEYVDFTLVKANSDTHEFQAMNVSGVKGGPIMCETRRTMVQPVNGIGHQRRSDTQYQSRPPRRSYRDIATRSEITGKVGPERTNRRFSPVSDGQLSCVSDDNTSNIVPVQTSRRNEARSVIDRSPRRPQNAPPPPPKNIEPTSTGDELLGFTKVTKKRTNKPKSSVARL